MDTAKLDDLKHAYYTDAVRTAAKKSDAAEVKRLLAIYPHGHEDALVEAVKAGSVACLHLLLPLCDSLNSEAMEWAALLGHHDCIDALFDVSDNTSVLNHLQSHFPNKKHQWGHLQDKVHASEEREQIKKHLLDNTTSKKRIM